MDILRTPDDRFAALPEFAYEPRYADIADGEGGRLRMAYVEDGPPDGPAVLLLHGEPTWSFLYRTMMPVIAAAGLRAVAPDLIGFGRSDKPSHITDYSTLRHVDWTRSLVFDHLDLRGVTLVGQDWGGLIGLRLAAEHPDRFAGLVAANAVLPTGDEPMPELWWKFRRAIERAETLDIPRVIQSGCRTQLSPEVRAAYDAPFPDERYKAAARAFPLLVPTTAEDLATVANRAAWAALSTSDTPVLVAFSDCDPITAPVGPALQRTLPGARGREHPIIRGAGHFLQEDAGPELARHVVEFVSRG
ncbi:MAG: haloalkane dehalogenase [Geodermatophilaceae bacterium]|nr:haloalkane dehalogenase [Geodermatophilaceae bacterium]